MKINTCKKCNVKSHLNHNFTCPFKDGEYFADNWNCGIISKIRALCDLAMEEVDKRLQYQFCEDQKYATIKTHEIKDMGLCLWVSWYKSRGRTEAMYILSENEPPKIPTFNDLKNIVEYYYND